MRWCHRTSVFLRFCHHLSASRADFPPLQVYNSMRGMNYMPGDVVAIQGLGGLGHLAVQFAKQMGFNVVALSSSDKKKDLAHELGAHHYVDGSKEDQAEALTKLGGAKIIVCTAPKSDIIAKLINGLAVGGQLLILALTDEVSVPVVYVYPSFRALTACFCLFISPHCRC